MGTVESFVLTTRMRRTGKPYVDTFPASLLQVLWLSGNRLYSTLRAAIECTENGGRSFRWLK